MAINSTLKTDAGPDRGAWAAPVRTFFSRLFKQDILGTVCAGLLAAIVLCALLAPWLAPYDFDAIDLTSLMQGPSWSHPLGTDELGRDILSRVIYGARTSVIVCITAALLSLAISVTLGVLSGYFGGRLDALVNAAGVWREGPVENFTEEDFDLVLGVNLKASFYMCQAAIPYLKENQGSIVNISSNSAFSGHYDPAYTASKWGLRGLTRTAAMEYVSWGIRVNSVCPGLIVTGLNAAAAHLKPMTDLTPLKRSGTAAEAARPVLFLAGEESSFITGEDFVIDGGFPAGAA